MKPTAEEIATEIRMRCNSSTGPFLLVEGNSDVIFFRMHTKISIDNIIPTFGSKILIQAMTILQKEETRKVLGVIDLDYRWVIPCPSIPNNVFITDSHDLETMMFNSPAFEKVLRQKSSAHKVRAYPNGSRGIKGKILKLSQPIGCLRFFSELKTKNYSFENLNCEKFIQRKNLSFSDKKFVSHLRGIHPNNKSITESILRLGIAEAKKMSILSYPSRLCCGHDIMEIMAIGLKSMWGSYSGTKVSRDLIEESFMLAYSHQMFSSSFLFKKIDKWFANQAYNSLWCE